MKILMFCFLFFPVLTLAAGKTSQSEKKKQIAELYERAMSAFAEKKYQKAIESAEKMRRIYVHGNTRYLNEAKQIIDKSRMQQKEEFEPFLVQARELYDQGDYRSSFDMCMEMVKVDPTYQEARRCAQKAERGMNGLIDRKPSSSQENFPHP